MNEFKKNITVRFFIVDAGDYFFTEFSTNFSLVYENDFKSRVFSIRNSKYLIRTMTHDNGKYFISVVKERNTWQAKATRDGAISGLSTNQGIIGDLYYYCVFPKEKMIFGFTTGPIGSLKNVGKIVLDQFNNNRKEKLSISLIPKEKEYSTLRSLPEYSSLHFKINSSSLIDLSDDAPELIKSLGSAPYIENNIQLSLDLECSDSDDSMINKKSLIEIVNYLSESDACTLLKVKGIDINGAAISLDFGNAFINYKTEVKSRNKYVDEILSLKILNSAFEDYFN